MTQRGIRLGIAGAGVMLAASALWLPWAHYRARSAATSTSLGAGPYAAALVSAGIFAVFLGLAHGHVPRRAASYAGMAIGCVATVTSALAAATRIADANNRVLTTGGQTSYAIGDGIAIITGIVIAALSLGMLRVASVNGRRPSSA